MTTEKDRLTNPARRLPDLEVAPLGDGAPLTIRARGRSATVVVVLHGTCCAPCRAYLELLEVAASDFLDWNGRVVVVWEGGEQGEDESRPEIGMSFIHASDPLRRVSAALGHEPPAVVVTDQWGEIHLAEPAGQE